MIYIPRGGPPLELEDMMDQCASKVHIGRRILRMALTWLALGAAIGVIGGSGTVSVIGVASSVLSGMIILPIPGALLGLIGGDAKGSVVGASGGLMACLLAKPSGGIPLDPVSVESMVIFGALAGATCVLYLQFVRWSYGVLFRRACQLVGGALVSCRAPALAGYLGSTNERSRNAAHFNSRPGRSRPQLTQHRNTG
jgi:hypothetical protein